MNLQRLKKLREEQRYSQRQLARAINMSGQQYFRIENGLSGTAIGTIEKLADVLKVPVSFLLEKEEGPAADPELEFLTKKVNEQPPERRAEIKRVISAMLALSLLVVVTSGTWETLRPFSSADAACAEILAILAFFLVVLLVWRAQRIHITTEFCW